MNPTALYSFAKWVRITMLHTVNGYSPEAARGKIKNGIWREDLHWKKAPDGNIMINPRAIDEWVETNGEVPERR